jgi:hypothetical protein
MNLSLKPRVFLTGFLPGFLFIVVFVLLYKDFNFLSLKNFAKEITAFSGLAIIILSFIIGQFFDAFRDFFIEGSFHLVSKYFPKIKDINWDFFYKESDKNIDRLDNNYYLFYLVNVDLAICLISILIMIIINWPKQFPSNFIITKCYLVLWLFAAIIVLLLDAFLLRREIVKHTNSINNDLGK